MPQFPPVRVRGGAHRLRRAVRRRRRAVAAGVALTAAALAASAPRGADSGPGGSDDGAGARGRGGGASATTGERAARPAPALVSAPVRIADAATVRLLRPGDRVDVIAVPAPAAGRHEVPGARVVARGVRVAEVPGAAGPPEGGALVVLSVPRALAAELLAASAVAGLAVALC
ncbi:hypothetical protein [Streptomyces sp. NPDC001985]|uniref:hypothetical protein n=1 Tax=Streptomyces sp. NPDC001985 TaxID=3154406 RepID=UPI0033296159